MGELVEGLRARGLWCYHQLLSVGVCLVAHYLSCRWEEVVVEGMGEGVNRCCCLCRCWLDSLSDVVLCVCGLLC